MTVVEERERESKEKYMACLCENRGKKKKAKTSSKKEYKTREKKIVRKGEGRKTMSREIQDSGKMQWRLMIYRPKKYSKLKTM